MYYHQIFILDIVYQGPSLSCSWWFVCWVLFIKGHHNQLFLMVHMLVAVSHHLCLFVYGQFDLPLCLGYKGTIAIGLQLLFNVCRLLNLSCCLS